MAITLEHAEEQQFEFDPAAAQSYKSNIVSALNSMIEHYTALKKEYNNFASNPCTVKGSKTMATDIVTKCTKRIQKLENLKVMLENRLDQAMIDYIGILDNHFNELEERVAALEQD